MARDQQHSPDHVRESAGGMDADWVARLRREVDAHIQECGLASAMNDTKWTELCALFQNSGLRYRIKDVLSDAPTRWDGEWYYHPRPYFRIEWLEINAHDFWEESKGTAAKFRDVSGDRTEEIVSSLRKHNIPFSREGDHIRIWGYLRPGAKPALENS